MFGLKIAIWFNFTTTKLRRSEIIRNYNLTGGNLSRKTQAVRNVLTFGFYGLKAFTAIQMQLSSGKVPAGFGLY